MQPPHNQPHQSNSGLKDYSKKSVVRWLCASQACLSIICFVCHIITTSMADSFNNELGRFCSENNLYFDQYNRFVDFAATGVWTGLFMIVASAVGLAGWRRGRKSLIVTHMVFNIFVIGLSLILCGAIVGSLSQFGSCKSKGVLFEFNSNQFDEHLPFPKDFVFFGETLTPMMTKDYFWSMHYRFRLGFYCESSTFTLWIALDTIILSSALTLFIVTIALLIHNHKAVGCCRRNSVRRNPGVNHSQLPAHMYLHQPSPGHVRVPGAPAALAPIAYDPQAHLPPYSEVIQATATDNSLYLDGSSTASIQDHSQPPPNYLDLYA